MKLKVSFGLVLCALALGGCGAGDDKIPISGTVFCDGKPLDGASVAFIGNNGGAYSSAVCDGKGEFKMRAAAGKNKVAVSKGNPAAVPPPDPNADQTMPTGEVAAQMMKAAPKPLVAEKFTDPEKSGIVIEVSGGMSSIDINVTSK